MSDILIAGMGYVGQAVKKLFPAADEYDPKFKGGVTHGCQYWLPPKNKYSVCMVCVPTPANEDGSCNAVAVEDVINKINADLFIIRSTVAPGTTERLVIKYEHSCVFQPEYIASSSPYPAPLSDITKHPFIILGGRTESVKKARKLYERVYSPTTQFIEMTAIEAEICKYMENGFIAIYVSFCNEFYDICKQFDADYDKVREGFIADPRMTKYWTYVYESMRGWGGHCLGKDMASIIDASQKMGFTPNLLKSVVKCNNELRERMVNA